jgi:hypothetical protein
MVSGEASGLLREKLENAATGCTDELAYLDLLRCPILTEQIDMSLKALKNSGNLFRPQQYLIV